MKRSATSLQVAPPAVRLALRYDPRPESGPGEAGALYDALLAHAVQAEACGVDLVWISERPLAPGARLPAALPLCAALAARSTRLRIGAGPLALPLYHPLRVAEDVATLDGLSGGRVELALGLGGAAEAFAGFGVERRGRGDRLEEGIALLRAAWTGEKVVFSGRHYMVSGVGIAPRPVQQPGPPIWVGASAGAAIRRAARLGAGLLAQDDAAVSVYLAARRALGAEAPARVAIARVAGEILSISGRDLLARLVETTTGAQSVDVVIRAETGAGSEWISPGEVEDLAGVLARFGKGS
ncbi:MAG: LLM class flavin-dependent oxidoreductase [Deltaproteobacteria bacterium]|nr:LLM class flavin-dependent oxidoreductase [Deltaproteobacteria bacterium]